MLSSDLPIFGACVWYVFFMVAFKLVIKIQVLSNSCSLYPFHFLGLLCIHTKDFVTIFSINLRFQFQLLPILWKNQWIHNHLWIHNHQHLTQRHVLGVTLNFFNHMIYNGFISIDFHTRNVLTDEIQTYEWTNDTWISHFLINLWVKCFCNV